MTTNKAIATLKQIQSADSKNDAIIRMALSVKKQKAPKRVTKKDRLDVIRREFLDLVYAAGLNITTIRKYSVERLQEIVRLSCQACQQPESKQYYLSLIAQV